MLKSNQRQDLFMIEQNRGKFIVGKLSDHSKARGWFFGHFADNGLLKSDLVEVCLKDASNGINSTDRHMHKSSVEINIVANGSVTATINGETHRINKGEFYVIWPEAVIENFKAEDDAELIIVRAPSINDKVVL